VYNNLNPVWEDYIACFEIIDDEELQENPLEVHVMDEDVIRDDLIGMAVIDLSPLVSQLAGNKMSGSFPIIDASKGYRGEIELEIRVIINRDENAAKHMASSLVSFFSTILPPLLEINKVYGLVEDLQVIRRVENEDINRVNLYKASLKIRRKIGKTTLKMGGNAVISYRQSIDFESSKSKKVSIRGYGTCVFVKYNDNSSSENLLD